ncbi:MAG: hypothetical protein Alpg2KO_21520 [Alphaproteobacteria bacterium]
MTATGYGLIVGLIGVFSLVAIQTTGVEVKCLLQKAADAMEGKEFSVCIDPSTGEDRFDVNQPPVLGPLAITIPFGATYYLPLSTILEASSDPNGDEFEIQSVSNPSQGNMTLADPVIELTPAAPGTMTIDVTLTDNLPRGTATYELPITVVDAPLLCFPPSDAVAPAGTVITGQVALSGATGPVRLEVSNGEAQVNGAAYSSSPQTIENGDGVRLRATAPSTPGQTLIVDAVMYDPNTNAQLASCPWTIRSEATSCSVASFSFDNIFGAQGNSTITSNSVTISGATENLTVSVSGGNIAIGAGTPGAGPIGVTNGDQISLSVTTPPGNTWSPITVNATITCDSDGSVSATDSWTVSPAPGDAGLTPIDFNDIVGADLNQLKTSNTEDITGISSPLNVTVSGPGGVSMLIDGVNSGNSGQVNGGDEIALQMGSSDQYATGRQAMLTFTDPSSGEVVASVPWNVTTRTRSMNLTEFNFNDRAGVMGNTQVHSNSVTIRGVTDPVRLEITNAEGTAVMVSRGNTYASTFEIQPNSTFYLRTTTPSGFAWPTQTFNVTAVDPVTNEVLHQASWNVDPAARDVGLSAFTFNDLVDRTVNTTYNSNSVSISGPNTAVRVSVTGASIRFNSNTGTTFDINPNGYFHLQKQSAADFSTTESATVTVTDPSDGAILYQTDWSITTEDRDTDFTGPTFNDRQGAVENSTVASNSWTLRDVNTPIRVESVNGSIRINSNTATTHMMTQNQTMHLRTNAPGNY